MMGEKVLLVYQGGKKCSFFGKFGVFCFLETPILKFTLLPYHHRIIKEDSNIKDKQGSLSSQTPQTYFAISFHYIYIDILGKQLFQAK